MLAFPTFLYDIKHFATRIMVIEKKKLLCIICGWQSDIKLSVYFAKITSSEPLRIVLNCLDLRFCFMNEIVFVSNGQWWWCDTGVKHTIQFIFFLLMLWVDFLVVATLYLFSYWYCFMTVLSCCFIISCAKSVRFGNL